MRIAQVGSSLPRICSNPSIPSQIFSPWLALLAYSRLGQPEAAPTCLWLEIEAESSSLPVASHRGDAPPISLASSSPRADMLISSRPQNSHFLPPISAYWWAALQLCSSPRNLRCVNLAGCACCFPCLQFSPVPVLVPGRATLV